MAFRSLAVHFCLLVAVTQSAAMPTQDSTVVVTKTDAEAPTTVAPEPESTSEGPLPAIKLTELAVDSRVRMRYAHTAVTAHVRNPAARAQEAHFRVLLPETAFISGFVMIIDGKSYTAYVKGKEEAKQIYQAAVSRGSGAAHISTKARDSNHFIVSVNMEASSNAIFNLTYEELLVRRNGVYNHAINLHPGSLVPKLTVTVNIKESQKLTELRVPEIRTGNEVEASNTDVQNAQAVVVKSEDGREATITFTPNLQEQETLMGIYAQKSKTSAADSQGVLGQFVVQYDVDRPREGEILVNDGYFVHFLAPPDLRPLNKFIVFVLDTSSSMYGTKIEQLREAMKIILGELNPGDYFNLVEFNSCVKVHDVSGLGGPESETNLAAPSPATPGTIEKAKAIVSQLQPTGGTDISSALDAAVQLIERGVDRIPKITTHFTTICSDMTTGESNATVCNEQETSTHVEHFTAPHLEPIIIFLTDGVPILGETDTKKITDHVTEKNSGIHKASLFSLAFGQDANRDFLRKISLRNGGFMRHIYVAADSALQLRDFYRQVSSPLLSDVKFTYPEDQVKENTVTKHNFRALYAGSEIVVCGRLAHPAGKFSPRVSAYSADVHLGRKPFEVSLTATAEPRQGYLPLERLWSYLTIKQLLDQKEAEEDDKPTEQDEQNTPEKKALRLALQYSFVTPVTSLVVVKPNETSAVDAESVDNAVPGSYSPQHSPNIGWSTSRLTLNSVSDGSSVGHQYPSSSANMVPYAAHSSSTSQLRRNYPTGLSGSSSLAISSGSHHYPSSSGLSSSSSSASSSSSSLATSFSGHHSSGFGSVMSGSSSLATSSGSHHYPSSSGLSSSSSSASSGSSSLATSFSGHHSSGFGSVMSGSSSLATSSGSHHYPSSSGLSSSSSSASSGSSSLATSFSGHHSSGFGSVMSGYRTHGYPSNYHGYYRPPHYGVETHYTYPSTNWCATPRLRQEPQSYGTYIHPSPRIRPGTHQHRSPVRHQYPTSSKLNIAQTQNQTQVPAPATTVQPSTTTSAKPKPSLSEYHLQDFAWVESLLDPTSDSLVLPTNATTVTMSLTKDLTVPKEAGGDAVCARAVGGGAGVCVYLTRCGAARQITPDQYTATYCDISGRFAGVCCTPSEVDVVAT